MNKLTALLDKVERAARDANQLAVTATDDDEITASEVWDIADTLFEISVDLKHLIDFPVSGHVDG